MNELALIDVRNLAVAAAIGFLIGFEREWQDHQEGDDVTFAGARTFTLVALLGGLAGLISSGAALITAAFIGVAVLTAIAYWSDARSEEGIGGTTEMAVLATVLLGALATRGHVVLAAATGVFITLLLSIKQYTERLAGSLTETEVHATIRFLVLSIIVLPLLPNKGFGPHEALNLREIWLMVVFISGLSFAGYWALKLFGQAKGVLMTGLVGGLASSTATTISLSQLSRDGAAAPGMAAAGIIVSNVVMVLRVGLLVATLALSAFLAIWPVLAAAVVAGLVASWYFSRNSAEPVIDTGMNVRNPLELKSALVFAALLGLLTVLAAVGVDQFGDQAFYLIALISGVVDVDAVTLAASRNSANALITPDVAGRVVLLAVAVNVIAKSVYAAVIGGRKLAAPVWLGMLAIIIIGAGAFLFKL